MSDLVRFDVGISGGLITSAEGKWVSYASHCASRDALVNVVDAQANEIERLRQRLVEAEARNLGVSASTLRRYLDGEHKARRA